MHRSEGFEFLSTPTVLSEKSSNLRQACRQDSIIPYRLSSSSKFLQDTGQVRTSVETEDSIFALNATEMLKPCSQSIFVENATIYGGPAARESPTTLS